MKKLTIGMLTFDDYDGTYFATQSIRLHHPEILDEVEFLVIDNNPEGDHGKAVKRLTNWIKEPVRYISMPGPGGTALRNNIFTMAETEYVLCMDCHVMFVPGALKALLDYFKSGADGGNLLQGPLVYDDLINIATHFDPIWRDHMHGIWATDPRGKDLHAEPFEIPAQGLGVFACRKSAWLGFNPLFRGFGGEECYIHEKYRQAGRKTMCLPFLRWLHRFDRPGGVKYPLQLEDRVRNYLLGHLELGLDPTPVAEHFKSVLGEEGWAAMWAKLRPEFMPKNV